MKNRIVGRIVGFAFVCAFSSMVAMNGNCVTALAAESTGTEAFSASEPTSEAEGGSVDESYDAGSSNDAGTADYSDGSYDAGSSNDAGTADYSDGSYDAGNGDNAGADYGDGNDDAGNGDYTFGTDNEGNVYIIDGPADGTAPGGYTEIDVPSNPAPGNSDMNNNENPDDEDDILEILIFSFSHTYRSRFISFAMWFASHYRYL